MRYMFAVYGQRPPGPLQVLNGVITLTSSPKDHWTLKTGYFEDPNPAIQVETLPLEGPPDP